jgi:branched-chain amino acid transport system substrate-binding protein
MRDHLPLTRDQLQRLGHILADLAQPLVATAWADRNVIAKLNATAKGAMAKPTVRARLADLGVDIPPPDPFASRDDSCSLYSRAAQRDVPKSRRFKVRRRMCPRRAGIPKIRLFHRSESSALSSERWGNLMSRMVNRRTFLASSAGVVAAFRFAPAIAQTTPFKIGLLTVKTGPLAQGGIQMEQGIAVFLKEKTNTLGGRRIELVAADTGGNAAGARTKAQELIERDKVNVILGPLAAPELLAITDYVRDKATPLVSLAAAEDVTQRRANPFVVRPSASSAQCCHVLGDYAAKDLKFRRVATIAEDLAFGYEQLSGFQRVFEDAGGKVVKKLWPPLVTPDYTPYIAQIGNVDCVVSGFAGSNPIKFMRAYADLGVKAKIPMIAGWTAIDDALLRSLGDEAIGVISAHWYAPDFDSPANRRFVAAMQRDYGVLPGGYSAGMYIAGQCVEAAIQTLGDKSEDRKAFAEALHQISLTDTPRGPVRFDHLGNIVGDVFIRKCERKNGQLVNTVIKRYPNVSQFWTYDEKSFLANPVYARDYPPAKNLEP